jgi:lipopolysaccharide export system permease protein
MCRDFGDTKLSIVLRPWIPVFTGMTRRNFILPTSKFILARIRNVCPTNAVWDGTFYLEALKVDRYIIRQFLVAMAVSLVAFIIIYVAIDLMEKLDKFLDKHVPWMTVLEYYINFTPQIVALILPVALLLGSLFTAGRMSSNNEIIALRSGGMSLYRYMLPFVFVALVLSGASIYFDGWVLPRANARVLEIQGENQITNAKFNVHLQDSPTSIISLGDFSFQQLRATRVNIMYFDGKDLTHLVKRIDAQSMSWDSVHRKWQLVTAMMRSFPSDTTSDIVQNLTPQQSLMRFSFTPEELKEHEIHIEEMTNTQLKRRIDLAERSGQDTSHDKVDYYSKYAMAFTSLIVVLFGVPFASRKKRGGLSVEFSVAIFISFVFLAFTKVSQTFGYSGLVNPMLTAWLANILFTIMAFGVIAKAQK